MNKRDDYILHLYAGLKISEPKNYINFDLILKSELRIFLS